MTDEDKRTINRLAELYRRSKERWQSAYSEFLTLAEQSLASRAAPDGGFVLYGGFEGAERRIACFGENAAASAPIVCLEVSPLSVKFAEELCHRDCLGALMSLGVRREVLGDILLSGGSAYVLCLEGVADFIAGELRQIRHTSVRCSRVEAPPENALPRPEEREFVVSSVRLDALISAVWSLSRAEGQALIAAGRASVNGAEAASASFVPSENDAISLRGYGRFVYCGVSRETKKGRIRVAVKVY